MARQRRDSFFGDSGDLSETVVQINRSAKVVKGGRRFSFSALAVVGDRRGRVGIGYGKANGVPPAVEKGISEAKKSLETIHLRGDTIPHSVTGRFGAAKVFMRPAGPGTGVIAGGGVRAVCQMVGIRNILTKSVGSNNPVNLVKAAMDGLRKLKDAKEVARLRGVPLEELVPEPTVEERAASPTAAAQPARAAPSERKAAQPAERAAASEPKSEEEPADAPSAEDAAEKSEPSEDAAEAEPAEAEQPGEKPAAGEGASQ